ncbi:hypothetical protein SKB0087_01130 [Anaerococcus nagyae]
MKNVDKFIFILKKDTEFNGLIPIYTKKGDEQNRFIYSATSPFYFYDENDTVCAIPSFTSTINARPDSVIPL